MTDILIEGKPTPDGVTKLDKLKIGIAWHQNGCAQVTITNKKEIPHRFQRVWIVEGKTEEVAGVMVEHKASEENKD